MNINKAAAMLGKKGGKVKSAKKKASSAQNGKKGGRPVSEKTKARAAAMDMLEVLEKIVLFDNNQTNRHGEKIGQPHDTECPCEICTVIKKARGNK